MPAVAVVQPLPGIGDMVWHLPHIRAIAAHVGAPVTLVAKSSAHAEQMLAGDTSVADVLRIDRAERGARFGAWDLAPALLRRRFRRAYLLHHSRTLAFALALAGIRERHGYGFGRQRLFLNRGPFLPPPLLHRHPYDQATAWLEAAGIALAEARPRIAATAVARAAARARIGAGPFVVLGIASSQPYKQWGAERFAALAQLLAEGGWPRIVLAGGPGEAALAAAIGAAGPPAIVDALGWDMATLAGLCAEAAFYVGNDTGAMNVAAAVGTRVYGLFGGTEPFTHSPEILPVMPPDGRIDLADGMARIAPEAVLAAIAADRGGVGPRVSG